MMDEDTKAILHRIKYEALHGCHEAMTDHDWHKAWELMDIYEHADHVCRKWWLIEHPEYIK